MTGRPAPGDPDLPEGDRPRRVLPCPLSTFIGRVDEQQDLARLVASNRLVSVVGTGGAGKTRLALAVATQAGGEATAELQWVELADLSEPEALVGAIALAVGVAVAAAPDDLEQLCQRLHDRRLLMVLDNGEQLIEPLGSIVLELLRSCPSLRVIVTSRAPLDIDGEIVWRIPPLSLPRADALATGLTAHLAASDSVRLFVDRAQRACSGFALDEENARSIAQICVLLDGVPLAIELAAARCRSLSPERILAGLTDATALLTRGSRTAPPRQRSFEASMTWSHQLLDDAERVLLRRLSVFTGGWQLADAEAVLHDGSLAAATVMDLIDGLVAQSLVVFEGRSSVPRYRLLEPVRQYARQRLIDADEQETMATRHAEHYATTAVALGPTFESAWSDESFAWAVDELPNLIAATEHLLSVDRIGQAVALIWSLHVVMGLVAPTSGQRLAEKALDVSRPTVRPEDAARLHLARADASFFAGDMAGAFIDGAAALGAAEAAGDEQLQARSGLHVAIGTLFLDPQAGLALCRTAADRSRACGDRYGEMAARCVTCGGALLVALDTVTGAADLDRAARVTEQQAHPVWLAWIDATLALLAAFQGHTDLAEELGVAAGQRLREVARHCHGSVDAVLQSSTSGGLAHFARCYAAYERAAPSTLHAELPERATRAHRDGFAQAAILFDLANGVYLVSDDEHGDPRAGAAALERAATDARASGSLAVLANIVPYLADVALQADDPHAVTTILAEIPPEIVQGSHMVRARFRIREAVLAIDQGEIVEAERLLHDALDALDGQDLAWETIHTVEVFSQIANAVDDHAEAARLLGGVARLRVERAHRQISVHRARADCVADAARRALGEEQFEEQFEAGRTLDMAALVAYLRRGRGPRRRPSSGWDSLTPTELDVAGAVADGLTNPQIAQRLFMSRETVKSHLSHIFAKLSVRNRTELAGRVTNHRATEPS